MIAAARSKKMKALASIRLGRIAIVGDGVRDVERLIDGRWKILRVGLLRRSRMRGVPGLRGNGDKIRSGVELRELVRA